MAKLTTMQLGLTPRGIALATRPWWRRDGVQVVASQELSGVSPPILTALDAMLADSACANRSVRVVLGDALVRFFMVAPPANARSPRDLQLAASLRFQTLYGEAADDWTLRAGWRAGHRFPACALRTDFSDGLHAVCRSHALPIAALQPHFVAAWDRWRGQIPRGGWFGVLQDEALSLGIVTSDGLTEVRRLALTSEARADPAWLPQVLEREALRTGVAPAAGLYCCGAVPTGWLTQPTESCAVHQLGAGSLDQQDQGPGARLLASIGGTTWH